MAPRSLRHIKEGFLKPNVYAPKGTTLKLPDKMSPYVALLAPIGANRELVKIINRSQSISKGTLVKSGIFLLPKIIEFNADTYSGSVGAAVINVETEKIVGVVTHGGCKADYGVKLGARYTNSGTSITGNKSFNKAVQACIAGK